MKIKDVQKLLFDGKRTFTEEQKQILLRLEKRQGPYYKQSYIMKSGSDNQEERLMIRYLMLINGRIALIIYPETLQMENKNITPAAFVIGDVVPIGEETFRAVIEEFEDELESAISCGETFEDPDKVPSKDFIQNIYDYIENRRELKRLYNSIIFGRVTYVKEEEEAEADDDGGIDDEGPTYPKKLEDLDFDDSSDDIF